MICVSDEKDIEKLLKNTRFTNEIHRERLWERLRREIDMNDELSEEELAMAAGGVTLPEIPPSSK